MGRDKHGMSRNCMKHGDTDIAASRSTESPDRTPFDRRKAVVTIDYFVREFCINLLHRAHGSVVSSLRCGDYFAAAPQPPPTMYKGKKKTPVLVNPQD